MEALLHGPSQGHHPHEVGGMHSVVEGEGEGEQQKKSVLLKKVKDKAKKIKDTIKKHGHGHHHHDEENDDEEEEDPEVHGAPIYESSSVVRSRDLPTETNTNVERHQEDRHVHEHEHDDHERDEGNSGAENKLINNGAVENIGGGSNGQSVTEYLSEKLKPGDEDKALSEAITEALHSRKREPRRGKVTVSKEVADRLGTATENKREGEDAVAAGQESSGQGLAERLQNAVTLWLGKSTGIQTAQDSVANAFVNDAGSGSGGVGPASGGWNEPRHR